MFFLNSWTAQALMIEVGNSSSLIILERFMWVTSTAVDRHGCEDSRCQVGEKWVMSHEVYHSSTGCLVKRLTSHTKEAGEILLEDRRGYQAYQLQGLGDCWLPQVSGMIYCQGDKNIITVLDP